MYVFRVCPLRLLFLGSIEGCVDEVRRGYGMERDRQDRGCGEQPQPEVRHTHSGGEREDRYNIRARPFLSTATTPNNSTSSVSLNTVSGLGKGYPVCMFVGTWQRRKTWFRAFVWAGFCVDYRLPDVASLLASSPRCGLELHEVAVMCCVIKQRQTQRSFLFS